MIFVPELKWLPISFQNRWQLVMEERVYTLSRNLRIRPSSQSP